MTDTNPTDLSRRGLLKLGAAGIGGTLIGGGAAACAPATAGGPSVLPMPTARDLNRDIGPAPDRPFAAPPIENVRIGFVGVGLQGSAHVRNLVRVDGCQITAVCDIVEEKVTAMQDVIVEAGFPRPRGYSRGEYDFRRMCEEEELDLVFTATPWRWHVPVCVAAMTNEKHAATEVLAALTVDECWELVETAEREQKHCVMMENVNYGRPEMMVLNMVRQGLFGELLHGECGYLHDLRAIKFSAESEGLWRRDHSMRRNGNLYPTHGLGPIAQCMNINRGDRFTYLVSMSSPSRDLQEYAITHFPPDAPQRQEQFVLGDVNTCQIMTELGRTIYVSHDTNLPRPYSRINMLQGTKGLFQGYPDRVHIEGRSEDHRWDDAESYYEEFEHPLWKQEAENAEGAGHGGMDYIEDYRLIKCLNDGLPTDMNVYDAAALSVVSPLSEISVAHGSQPVAFPDFTRGKWRKWPPLEVVSG